MSFWSLNVFLLTITIASLPIGRGSKVLLVPWPFTSHISEFVNIGEGLVERGHEVHCLTTPSWPGISKYDKSTVNFMTYHLSDPDYYQIYDDKKTETFIEHLAKITLKEDFRTSIEGYDVMCSNPLKDANLYKRLKAMKFDIAIVDVFPMGRCTLVLLHRLGIPFVAMETTDEPWLLRNPALPSAWPTNIAETPHTEKMDFWERLDNLWAVIDWAAFPGISYMEDDYLTEYFYETPPVPLNTLVGRAQLWLTEFNTLLEYPRLRMPNEVHVGGLTTKPAKPLDDELEKYMSSNPAGVVVVSYGSLASFLPEKTISELLEAFKKVKYNVIMGYSLTPPDGIPKRIRLQPWLPQNDLLGHKNTKLFITHCGANGQNEALYHGVPMIGMPVFAEQPHNAKRMVYQGYGQALSFNTFTATELAEAINEVISNGSYAEKIAHASAIFKDQPMTQRDKALFWIEHVLKYGGAHMRSHALDMPWYQYLMLDILLFVFIIFLSVLIAVVCTVKKLISAFHPESSKKKRE